MKPGLPQFVSEDLNLFQRMGLALAAGGLTVLTLPPFSWLIAVPVAFSVLFIVLRNISTSRAFLVGWAFGLGQFGIGISWIAESFYVDAERFGALAIPAVAGLSAGLFVAIPGLQNFFLLMMALIALALLTSAILLPTIIVVYNELKSRITLNGAWLDYDDGGTISETSVLEAIVDNADVVQT